MIETPNRYTLGIGIGQYADDWIPALPAGFSNTGRLYDVLINPIISLGWKT